ncbi:MAG TPA: hypothetical protein VEL82_04210 [Thermoplasmata archaeon]|nr:hypothetical protein [Thermoplasmata archaeon]
MSLPLSPSVRRFALLLQLSVLWKVAALVVFLVLVVRLTGGGGL